MEQIKRLVAVGTSKAVIIPKSWLTYHRRKYGRALTEVYVTITEMLITVSPVPPTTSQERKP